MTGATLCSGVGTPEFVLPEIEWKWCAETDPFASTVLAQRFLEVPNLGDIRKISSAPTVDIVVAGTPCQSFSVAGKRAGLDDPRGVLAFELLRVAELCGAKWILFENVPGLLSSGGGRDFAAFLKAMEDAGYSAAWRVLDAQWFGVAQRRKRLFVVGYFGDWRSPAAVLFEPQSMRRDPAPSRKAWQNAAPTLAARTSGGGGHGTDFDCDGGLIPEVVGTIAGCSNAGGPNGPGRTADDADTLIVWPDKSMPVMARNYKGPGSYRDGGLEGTVVTSGVDLFNQAETGEIHAPLRTAGGHGAPAVMLDVADPLTSNEQRTYSHAGNNPRLRNVVAFTQNQTGDVLTGDVAGAISTNQNASGRNTAKVHTASAVRRLTPKECERLQGLPDDWTLVEYRGKLAKDGPRYKAIGNAMAAPVVRWIGLRIIQIQSEIDALVGRSR